MTFTSITYINAFITLPRLTHCMALKISFLHFLFPSTFFLLFSMMWLTHLFYNVVFPTWHVFLSPSLIYSFCISALPEGLYPHN